MPLPETIELKDPQARWELSSHSAYEINWKRFVTLEVKDGVSQCTGNCGSRLDGALRLKCWVSRARISTSALWTCDVLTGMRTGYSDQTEEYRGTRSIRKLQGLGTPFSDFSVGLACQNTARFWHFFWHKSCVAIIVRSLIWGWRCFF